jgi:hypothetical protein
MKVILKNWDLVRMLRFGMGLWVLYSSFTEHQPLLGLIGVFFVYQALMNVGCCSSRNCSISENKTDGCTPKPIN